ncbi:hypothetical protein DICPUDRAFT_80265 [Dictyostelium purpureum]|uniref:Uncharacterized protein n=1 Tax=Dictyostelium purpureum TaxID=5786 RepID=F0ZPZ9_DICPU|nr:uncharacterized protein DICPUDRAFT_80265 [Dictyostelium purpureum]EGC33960.1 hypothetical protein DICPUDRAFT_80265 [Dictyostelium purpureum]|eukprot:XP_003289493.1 hypothetical protein DICPUDRAFT_80265 [Dictyostelium purpureum]
MNSNNIESVGYIINNEKDFNKFINSITNDCDNFNNFNNNNSNNNNNNNNNIIESLNKNNHLNILNKIESLSIIESDNDDSIVPNEKQILTPPSTPTKSISNIFESPARGQYFEPICPGAPKKNYAYLQPKTTSGNCKKRILFPDLNQELNSSNDISSLLSPKVSKSQSQIQFIPSSSFKNIDSPIARKRLLF